MHNSVITAYIDKHENWRILLDVLRNICLETEMVETVKWGIPTYTINEKNVVGIAAFKHHVALWFYNGVFLVDEEKQLFNAQKGTTKAMRQWRFKSIDELNPVLIRKYLDEAVANEKAGKRIEKERSKPLIIPDILNAALKKEPILNQAFEKLSLGKKREYAEHIASAKREKTRLTRLEKCIPMIIEEKGLNDKYRKG